MRLAEYSKPPNMQLINVQHITCMLSIPPAVFGLAQTISTYRFVTGSPFCCASVAQYFLFGKTIQIRHTDLDSSNLEMLISRNRNVILVGHDVRHDLSIPQRLDFEIRTSMLGVFNTQKIGTLLKKLRFPWNKLHNAGNDSHFSLRPLSPLAIDDSTTIYQIEEADWISIKIIALQPIPQKLTSEEEVAKSRPLERLERSPGSQAEFGEFEIKE